MMNTDLGQLLDATHKLLNGSGIEVDEYSGPLHVGVDLGTAYTVLIVLDERSKPIAGAMRFANVMRDGVVLDFKGAVELLQELKLDVEGYLGRQITEAYAAYPPGVPPAERSATSNVLQGADLECLGLVDEPTAANAVLGINNGAIVDVGGGTTGVAIFRDGKPIYTADEPTGGTHFSLVVAGALDISFEDAEKLKTTVSEQERLYPILRPVMEKVTDIVQRHVSGHNIEHLHLVGGAGAFLGFAQVLEETIGLPTIVPKHPLYVTPLGIASQFSGG